MSFPDNFVWGAAAASYQIEGGAYEDGKGLSVWDVFSHQEGAIWHGHNGDVACDHYHRYAEDVGLMKDIGLNAYRLSISWPRILPTGVGEVNAAGLDFYDKLVDELLAANITPYITLFHWDFPYELYCKGGWLNRDAADWFADFTTIVVDRLSDRVHHWITFNEPSVFMNMGHRSGLHAPGAKLPPRQLMRAAHNVHLAHGKSVQAIRAAAKSQNIIGIAPNAAPLIPHTQADVDAARETFFAFNGDNFWSFALWTDPILLGKYPDNELHQPDNIQPGDMELMQQPIDFVGVNIYFGDRFQQSANGFAERVPHSENMSVTLYEWPITPEALYWGPKFLYERYGLPIYITENGLSCMDWLAVDGKVHDPQRIDFLTRYLRSLHQAIEDGVEVHGYFQWSIMDNFEWASGFQHRFGLIYVNYDTQTRILKDSAHWYRELIASNGATLLEKE